MLMRLGGEWSRLYSGRRLVIIALLLVLCLFLWRLASVPPGLSASEQATRSSAASLHSIAATPLYLPHSLVQYFFIFSGHGGIFFLRFASVMFAIFFIYCFYAVVRSWFGLVVGIMGTLLFVSNPWIINMARTAAPSILFLAPIFVIASYFWFLKSDDFKNLSFLMLVISSVASLYVPSLIFFLVFGIVFVWKDLRKEVAELSRWLLLSGALVGLILITPLMRAAVIDPSFIKLIFGVPIYWHGLKEVLTSIVWSFSGVFWHTRAHGDLTIDKLPLLNISQIVLGIFGLYAMWQQARREFIWLVSIFIFGVIFAGIKGNQDLLILSFIPFAIFVCAGLRYLYIEWRSVFPRNPLPRALSIFLIGAVVLMNLVYGLRYSLIAWPKTEATHSAYMLK